MKTATVPCRGPLSHGRSILAALISASSLFLSGPATAESVDSELLLLVDASKGELKSGEFDSLIEGYATALTSDAVLNSIASGATGKIAVSLSFFGVKNAADSRGVDWMAIGSLADAQVFVSQMRSLSQPNNGSFSYQDALTQGLASMGNEVGGSDNGFQSAVQIIEVVGAKKPSGNAGDVADASLAALNQGVDLIGATVIGKNADKLESYYDSNVIGGIGAAVRTSPIDSGLASVLTVQLSQSVGTGAITSVPEPTPAMLLISSMGIFLLFVRKRAA